jgi:hypothetical protein
MANNGNTGNSGATASPTSPIAQALAAELLQGLGERLARTCCFTPTAKVSSDSPDEEGQAAMSTADHIALNKGGVG